MAGLFLTKLLLLLTIALLLINGAHAIVNGHNATRGQFPYSAVLTNRKTYHYFCGASIITNWHVITAGHCVAPYKSNPHDLMLGIDVWDLHQPVRFIDISKFHINPFRDFWEIRYDVAVLRTASEIIFTAHVKPIALPTEDLPKKRDFQAVIAGWGALWEPANDTDRSPTPDRLQYQMTTVLSLSDCRQSVQPMKDYDPDSWSVLNNELDRTCLCTGNPKGSGACVGDSGNGIVWNNTLIAVASSSVDCAVGYPDLHINVYSIVHWIKDMIAYLEGNTETKFV